MGRLLGGRDGMGADWEGMAMTPHECSPSKRKQTLTSPDLSINIKKPAGLLSEEQAKEILRRHIENPAGREDLQLRANVSATVIRRAALPESHHLSTPIPYSVCAALGFSRVRAYRWRDANK